MLNKGPQLSLLSFFAKSFAEKRVFYGYKTPYYDQISFDKILNKLQLDATYKPGNVKIVDVYPSLGIFSSVLNQALKPLDHIMLEPHLNYIKALNELKEYLPNSNIKILETDPFKWISFFPVYQNFDLFKNLDKNNLNPQLLLHANLNYPRGEALIMQWYGCLINRNWVQQYGNVRMLVWCAPSTAAKLVAKAGSKKRSKCSLVAETFSNTKLVAVSEDYTDSVISKDLIQEHQPVILPLYRHPTFTHPNAVKDLCLIDIHPKYVDNIQDLDAWDFVTKQLFILANNPLKAAINNLGPGAYDYTKETGALEDLWEKKPKDMTKEDFNRIAQVITNWPFRPDILADLSELESHIA